MLRMYIREDVSNMALVIAAAVACPVCCPTNRYAALVLATARNGT